MGMNTLSRREATAVMLGCGQGRTTVMRSTMEITGEDGDIEAVDFVVWSCSALVAVVKLHLT